MTTKLAKLRSQYDSAVQRASAEQSAILDQIQAILNAQWDDWKALQTTLTALENFQGVRYCADHESICAWLRFNGLTDVPASDRDHFESYLSEKSCAYVDWENDVLKVYFGPDEIMIQDDTGRDNGVYQSGKCIIDESEYTDEETGEVDEAKRNALIESHMERTGFFPGVFRMTRHDDEVYPVDTRKKGE